MRACCQWRCAPRVPACSLSRSGRDSKQGARQRGSSADVWQQYSAAVLLGVLSTGAAGKCAAEPRADAHVLCPCRGRPGAQQPQQQQQLQRSPRPGGGRGGPPPPGYTAPGPPAGGRGQMGGRGRGRGRRAGPAPNRPAAAYAVGPGRMQKAGMFIADSLRQELQHRAYLIQAQVGYGSGSICDCCAAAVCGAAGRQWRGARAVVAGCGLAEQQRLCCHWWAARPDVRAICHTLRALGAPSPMPTRGLPGWPCPPTHPLWALVHPSHATHTQPRPTPATHTPYHSPTFAQACHACLAGLV